jgi:hypothetical protein
MSSTDFGYRYLMLIGKAMVISLVWLKLLAWKYLLTMIPMAAVMKSFIVAPDFSDALFNYSN